VGDRVLVSVAELIVLNIRSSDKAARWGGEEFLILVPETDAEGALDMAEKLCREVATGDFGSANPVTISAGLSQFRGGDDADTLLKRADETLYQAKRTGRNRVISHLSSPDTGVKTHESADN
jgi:diguanylate cyclase (GGDEF)-like protein